MCKDQSRVHRMAVERTLDCGEMTRNRCGLAAGMSVHHSATSAIMRHAFAAVALGFGHSSCGHKTYHDRSRQQKQRQERNSDSPDPLHRLRKSIGSTTIGRNTVPRSCRLRRFLAVEQKEYRAKFLMAKPLLVVDLKD